MFVEIKKTGASYLLIIITLVGVANVHGVDNTKNDADIQHQEIIDARIPMDGKQSLSARVWRPAGDNAVPTVFHFTPYQVADSIHAYVSKYTNQGYAFIVVDVRGRGGSDGAFTPHEGLSSDGCETIGWIKTQPWSNGQVVMQGSSYSGMVQWKIAAKCADKLAAIVPSAAAYSGVDFPSFENQITAPYVARWLALVAGRSMKFEQFGDDDFWQKKHRELFLSQKPFHQYDDMLGLRSPYFDRWIDQLGDASLPLWASDNPSQEEMAKIDIPILSIAGYFDGDQPGALRYYREHMAAAPASAKDKHYLLLGPWDHAGAGGNPRSSLGGLSLDQAAVLDLTQLHIDFYNWVLRGGQKPDLLKNQFIYYNIGDAKWRSSQRLEDVSSKKQVLYLSADKGEAYDVFSSGQLVRQVPFDQEPTHYISNPLDTAYADWFNLITPVSFDDNELRDIQDAFLPQMRVFHSPPLTTKTIISGQAKLTLFLDIDTPDTDIYAAIYAIEPDGRALRLGWDIVRARFREGTAAMKLVEPNAIQPYEFKRFYWLSKVLKAGTRLRLVVGPAISPQIQLNFNSGGRLGYESGKDARTATVQIHHNKQYPSRLEIPIE